MGGILVHHHPACLLEGDALFVHSALADARQLFAERAYDRILGLYDDALLIGDPGGAHVQNAEPDLNHLLAHPLRRPAKPTRTLKVKDQYSPFIHSKVPYPSGP